MSKYADTLKAAKDLLTKSYNYNKKVEIKSSAGGTGYTAEAVIGKPAVLSLKGDFAAGPIKVDSVKIGSDDKIALEFSTTEVAKGLKLSFKSTDASRAAGSAGIGATVGAEYKTERTFTTLDIDVLETATLPVAATHVFNYNGFLLGGQAALQAATIKPTDYNVLVAYKNKSTTAGVQTSAKLTKATASIYQVVNPEWTVAGQANFPVKGAGRIDVQAGFAYKLAADATVHAKATSTGKIGATYAHVLSPAATLTLATEIDAQNLASDDHKFGINLALKL